MKAEIKEPNKTWQPVALELTFETEQELDAFRTMIWRDSLVPRTLYENGYLNGSKRDVLANCMQEISVCLLKLKEKM